MNTTSNGNGKSVQCEVYACLTGGRMTTLVARTWAQSADLAMAHALMVNAPFWPSK